MKKVIAYVHTHWDREWYREFEEFRLRLIEVFDEVLAALKNGELPCFYFDGQISALEDYLEIYPDKYDEICNLIKEKKLRIGPFYCSADSFLVSGECLYRNLEIGIKKSKDFGETEFIGYLSDTFGHSKCIPYILKSFNIDNACLWRGLGEHHADLLWDGIKVTYLVQGYYQDFLHLSIPIAKKAELLKKYIDKISLKSSDNVLLPIGADHLAVAKNIKKQIKELNSIYSDYDLTIATPFDYFKSIKERTIVRGEFLNNKTNFILPGVYSSGIYIKQANAYSQWLLTRISEPIQALSSFFYGTKNKQKEIDYAYKQLIKNHAHDSIYGCSIDNVADDVMERYKKVDIVSSGVLKRTIRDLSSKNGHLAVINLSNYEYSGAVKIRTNKVLPKWMKAVKISSQKGFTDEKLYNINEVPITEDITDINEYIIDVSNLESFSLNKITQDNICKKTYLKTASNSIENENIKLKIDNKKILLTDKKKNKTYNNFISITDRADIGDSYNFGALKDDKKLRAELVFCKLKESNNQRAVLSLKYSIKIPSDSSSAGRNKKTYSHHVYIDAILYNQSEYIEFNINWENKSKNHLMQIEFALDKKITKTLNEDLFGITERTFDSDYNIYDNLPAQKGIELKTNTSPIQRFVQTQNFALITKGNCEYEIYKNTLSLTILRATGLISNPINPTRGTPAGPPLKTPKLQCLGLNKAEFAIAFTNDENKLFKFAEHFYCSVVPVFTDLANGKLIEIDNDSILVYAVKRENNDLIIRVFNMSEKEELVRIKSISGDKESECIIKPKEIKNIVIKR